MSDRKHKTTAKELAYFEARVLYWQARFSLGDWKIEVFRDTIEESATCEMWHNAHGAHVRLSNLFGYAPSKQWLNKLALHEVGHVLLCDLKRLINERTTTDAQSETAEHAVIRRLERALCDYDLSAIRMEITAVRAAPSLRRLAKR